MVKILVIVILVLLIMFLVISNNVIPIDIGITEGNLKILNDKNNSVSSQTDDKEKYVEPLEYIGDVQGSKDRIINVLTSYEGCKIILIEDNYIHAVFKSKFFRFKDDVEFYFSDVIHYRSESRVGSSDGGANRKRYGVIRNAYYNQ